jgi:DNA-binding winged helix-turn-helix (wHTH) protein
MHHDELGPLMRRRLAATIDELSEEFHRVFSRGTVERFVHESSDQFGDRPTTGPDSLPLLVGRFAPERLSALAQADGRVEKSRPEVLGQGSDCTIGPLEVSPDDMLVSVAGRPVWSTRRELDVLAVLAEQAGGPVARGEIYARIWGPSVAGFKDRSVAVYIRRLRVKLAAVAPGWQYIHTHHAIGYRLEPEPCEEES